MRASFEHQRMQPRNLAFFGAGSDEAKRIDEQARRLNNSTTASRFLVEYVAAQPPSGEQQLTGETLDELMALSAELISRALLSDAIKYNLADPEVSILESSRLGVDRTDRYYEATTFFSMARAEKLVREAVRRSDVDEASSFAIASEEEEALNNAAIEEFGFSFVDLAEVTSVLWRIAYERGGASVSMSLESAIELVSSETDMVKAKVADILDSLVIKPRPDFFADFGPNVYPWRYNRSMSYLRRPLIYIGDGEPMVI